MPNKLCLLPPHPSQQPRSLQHRFPRLPLPLLLSLPLFSLPLLFQLPPPFMLLTVLVSTLPLITGSLYPLLHLPLVCSKYRPPSTRIWADRLQPHHLLQNPISHQPPTAEPWPSQKTAGFPLVPLDPEHDLDLLSTLTKSPPRSSTWPLPPAHTMDPHSPSLVVLPLPSVAQKKTPSNYPVMTILTVTRTSATATITSSLMAQPPHMISS